MVITNALSDAHKKVILVDIGTSFVRSEKLQLMLTLLKCDVALSYNGKLPLNK